MENTLPVTEELTKRQSEIVSMLWDALKRDPNDRGNRRITSWGSKTKIGLARSIESLFEQES